MWPFKKKQKSVGMTTKESLTRFGIVPADEHLPVIRDLLAQEAAAERAGRMREDELALLCCVQLFGRGLLEDVLLIWNAKRSGMDLASVIDIEFLFGAGVEETKRFLAGLSGALSGGGPDSVAAQALRDIESYVSGGFSPAEHLEVYKKYFRVA